MVGMSTWPAGSFCQCCFWQAVICLWSVQVCGFPITQTSTLVGISSWNQLVHSVCIVFESQWDVCGLYTCPGSPITQISTAVGMSSWPASSFWLYWFWQAVKCLWSLYMSGFPHHTDLHTGRNVYLTSFVVFDRWWDICGPYTCPGSQITRTSTLVGMSTQQAISFYLCCFWQMVRHLWSLHVSRIHCHMDLHSSSNVYPTSWFILSVLFLTGIGTSVVPTCVWDPLSHGPPPWKKRLPNQLVHSVCDVFDGWWDIYGPYTCLGSPITWTSTQVGTSTWPAASFCLCCFWQVVRRL